MEDEIDDSFTQLDWRDEIDDTFRRLDWRCSFRQLNWRDSFSRLQLFPDVAAAFADGSLRRLDTYKDVQPGEFLSVAVTRVQHRLCDFEARSAQARILEKIAEAGDKAVFLSGGEEGAYWLMNPGSFKSRARPVRTSSLTLRILSSVRTYAARIARFRATVSLATAVAVASALRYGVDHLSKGAVDPADGCSHSDEDVLAL